MKAAAGLLFAVLAAGPAACGSGSHLPPPLRAPASSDGGQDAAQAVVEDPAGPQAPLDEITIILPSGSQVVAEFADDPLERQIGLMGRTSLAPLHGLLLASDADGPMPIWMMNCLIPLDLVWIESGGRVSGVMENVPPCRAEPCPVYDPGPPARYVLELPAGTVRSEGLRAGSAVRFVDLGRGRRSDSPARD